MSRFFNTTGPCRSDKHYMLSAIERCRSILPLIDQESYFILHAARQSGKTTLLKSLADDLNQGGRYHALYCSLEQFRMVQRIEEGIPGIIRELEIQSQLVPGFPLDLSIPVAGQPLNDLREALSFLCKKSTKPLILLWDEVDCLRDDLMLSFLSQIRNGYVNRSMLPFPHSMALVGMRNIRDYKAQIRSDRETLGSASPFNIIAESLTLTNFTLEEVRSLYAQHTTETGQVFESGVVERVQQRTGGQPWLVNAVAREVIQKILTFDMSKSVTVAMVEEAIQNIILRRDTHIDSLLERLKEPRVRRIIEPVILGKRESLDPTDDDRQYVIDLGLLVAEGGVMKASNPIYAEVILRALSWRPQEDLGIMSNPLQRMDYINAEGLEMRKLLEKFQIFWRENAEIWGERYDYKEAAPHLILMAFLQRVINGGGTILREFALGSGRLDLLVEFQGKKYPVEVKLDYGPKTREEAKEQLIKYLDRVGEKEGWVVIFDRKSGKSLEEKSYWDRIEFEGRQLNFVGC